MPLNAIFHLVAKRNGEPGEEAVAAMEEGGEGKGAAGGASPKGVRADARARMHSRTGRPFASPPATS